MSKLEKPPIIKQPRPLFTLGNLKLIIFTVIMFFIKNAVNVIVSFFKVPYDFLDGSIKKIESIPLLGAGLSLPLKPIKALFGGIIKLVSGLASVFNIIFYVLLVIIILLIILKIISRIRYIKSKKAYYAYHKNLLKSDNILKRTNQKTSSMEPEKNNDFENTLEGNKTKPVKIRKKKRDDTLGDMNFYS